jgi:hypothetical protein
LRKRQPPLWERIGLTRPPGTWHSLTLYDLTSARQLGEFPKGRAARFSPDSSTLVVLTEDERLQLWDIPPHRPWWKITGFAASAGIVVFFLGFLRRGARAKSVDPAATAGNVAGNQ